MNALHTYLPIYITLSFLHPKGHTTILGGHNWQHHFVDNTSGFTIDPRDSKQFISKLWQCKTQLLSIMKKIASRIFSKQFLSIPGFHMKALSICCVFCTFVIPYHSIHDLLQSYSSKQKLAGFIHMHVGFS